MKFIYTCFFACLLLNPSVNNAQDAPLGGWKDYLSYSQGKTVTMGQNEVYCVAGAAMFSYNINDNSIDRLNKVTGLSDVNPTVARFNSYDNKLVIGYPDGNIDVMYNKTITNVPDLKNSSVQGSKAINNICFYNNTAYIGCGQGILQFDLTQDVIQNTFYIGAGGTALNVRGITTFDDSIFAATDNGIYKASLNDPNLNNYSDWIKVGAPLPTGVYNTITTVGDSLYVNLSLLLSSPSYYDRDTIYSYCNGQWRHYKNDMGNTYINSLESGRANNKNHLVISSQYSVQVFDTLGNMVVNAASYIFGSVSPNDAILDANMNIWVADNTYGMVSTTGAWNGGIIYNPPGPYSNRIFDIAVEDNDIWIAPGGYDASHAPSYIGGIGISAYNNDTWHRLLASPDSLSDLNCIAIDPNNPLHAFVGCWGRGLVEYNNNTISKVYNATNSTMGTVNSPGNTSIRIGGVAFDTLGNLWVTSSITASKYLSVHKADGTWQAFDFSNFLNQTTQVTKVIVTQSGAKWVMLYGTGILVYQDNGTFAAPNSNNTHLITSQAGNGALPDLNITAMAEDKDGAIWVGTDQSVVVFYSPDNVLDGSNDWDAQPVYVTQNGYTQYLMQNQTTTAIAVDGANRKWIGTQGGGVFLMSADGTQQIYNFTSSNSPLLSNNILCMAINQQTGEVFFGTDKGVVSFRGDATEGGTTFGNVYAYPDPVPHGYNGPIAITGLVTNSDVKITTVNGQLVYHTTALGGQAIWNGNNFDGKRVQTGVYLVFSASPDGSETQVTKLLFIN